MGLSGSDKAYRQARSNLARSGATRAGYFAPNVGVLIGGTNIADRTASITIEELSIEERAGDEPDHLSCTLRGPLAERPLVGERMIVFIGADQPELRLFSGVMTTVRQTQTRAAGSYSTWVIDAVDLQFYLDRRTVTAAYVDVSATDVARDILRLERGPDAPIWSDRYITRGLPKISVDFVNARASDALRTVADLVGGTVFWDESFNIHLFTSEPTAPSPAALTDTATHFWDLVTTTVYDQLRTRVIVEGQRTTALLSTPTETITLTANTSAPVDYLVVGGGGGGGPLLGGGGGGGGVLTGSETISSGSYAVVVGAGGAAATNGNASSWNQHVALGGGRGASTSVAGGSGGSGGGGAAGQAAGAGTTGQGTSGGGGFAGGAGAGGGGGGADAPGAAASAGTIGGNGGAGRRSDIDGTGRYFGGGGGGNGSASSGNGGIGGGGKGGAGGNPGVPGTVNTGGGGGGGGTHAGGSGKVVIRYATGTLSATGGTITTSGGYTVHTFTSDGTFTVSTLALVSPPPIVEDMPVADASRLDPAGGLVRIGTHLVTYSSLIGPLATGQNAPGSVLSSDVAANATSMTVDDSSVFTGSFGWVKAGDQLIRYGSKSGSNLQGIPALGYGAIQSALSAGTAVTSLGAIQFTGRTFNPPIDEQTPVIQRVVVNDTPLQDEASARTGQTGIYEYVIDAPESSVDACYDRAASEFRAGGREVVAIEYTTRDWATRAGRMVDVNLTGQMGVTGRFRIQQVSFAFADRGNDRIPSSRSFPIRRVTAAPVMPRTLIEVTASGEDSLP